MICFVVDRMVSSGWSSCWVISVVILVVVTMLFRKPMMSVVFSAEWKAECTVVLVFDIILCLLLFIMLMC